MLSSGFHSTSPAAAAAPIDDDESGSPASSSSVFTSDIPHPTSHIPQRRPVPLLFDPCINDEANIFEALGESRSSIVDLAFEHNTTVQAFSMWLMREDVQAKLSAVTAAGACATRIGAVTQLPEAVGAMVLQIRGCISDETHRLSTPGLETDKMQDRRRTTARRAAHMLLRLATFDPSRPLYRRRVQREEPQPVDSESTSSIRYEVPTLPASIPQSAFRTPQSVPPTSDIGSPSILDLCSIAMSALANSRFSNLAVEPIRPESSRDPHESDPPDFANLVVPISPTGDAPNRGFPAFTSDIRHPTSDIVAVPHPTSDIPARAPPAH